MSASLTLPHYGRVARYPLTIAKLTMRTISCLPGGIARQNSRSLFPPSGPGVIAAAAVARNRFYLSICEAQFRRMESGAPLASSTLVMIRNLCPSPLTS